MNSKIFFSIFIASIVWIKLVKCDESYRLPNNSYPLKYDLWLKMNIESGSTFFEGRVKIQIKIKEESDSITLHSKDLIVSRLSLTILSSLVKYENIKYKLDNVRDFMTINLPETMLPESEILLDISYRGEMVEASSDYNNNRGFLIAAYTETNEITKNYIFTHFEPSLARQCLPCYDEPQIRAIFALQIEHHSSYNAVANMPVIRHVRSNKTKNYNITTFQETPKMQTYLLAFFVSEFQYVETNDLLVRQRIYARNIRMNNGDVDYPLGLLDEILKLNEDYFGIRFSLPKLDHVIAPDFFTAIENWGIIGYSERDLFDSGQPRNIRTILHEFAHQYFGNLVAPKWWSYAWLNEGFAKFYDLEFLKLIFPERINTIEEIWQKLKFYAFYDDKMSSSKSLNHYVELPDEVNAKFSYVTYYKGAAIIQMFQEAFGYDTWKKGIIYYLKNNQYSAAEPNDLHEAIQRAIDEDFINNSINVDFLMRPWEDQPGFPTVHVKIENETLKLLQERIVEDDNAAYSSDMLYTIPITYSTSSDPDFTNFKTKFWMVGKKMEIKNFTEKWIILNNKQIGFYKVDYDDNLWSSIISQLHKNHSVIHSFNRECLFDSISRKVDSKKRNDYKMFLKMLSYLKHEEDMNVVLASQNFMRIFLMTYEDEREVIRENLQETFEIIYEKAKYYKNTKTIKEMACLLRVPVCISDAVNDIFKVLELPDIDPEFSFCNGLKYVNETSFEIIFNFAKNMKDSNKTLQLIYDLGCVENAELYEKVLNILVDPEWDSSKNYINPQYFIAMMDSKVKIEVFLNFIENNYMKIQAQKPLLLYEIFYYFKHSNKDKTAMKRLLVLEELTNKINNVSYNTDS